MNWLILIFYDIYEIHFSKLLLEYWKKCLMKNCSEHWKTSWNDDNLSFKIAHTNRLRNSFFATTPRRCTNLGGPIYFRAIWIGRPNAYTRWTVFSNQFVRSELIPIQTEIILISRNVNFSFLFSNYLFAWSVFFFYFFIWIFYFH